MNKLKELRLSLNLSQVEAAQILHISRRSYQMYESSVVENDKYLYLVDKLYALNIIDEEHGLLTIDKIRDLVKDVLTKYETNFCYLFGSYAKGYAREDSDIDLLIDSPVTGLKSFGFVEELRETLHKKVDVVFFRQLEGNLELTKEILKDGIKIYDQRK